MLMLNPRLHVPSGLKRDRFCEMKPNFRSTLSSYSLPSHCVLVSWLPNNPSVFAGELPTISVCHWMFNDPQTFMSYSLKTARFGQKNNKKKHLCEIIGKRNSKVCWKDFQSCTREAAASADDCLRWRPDI